MLTRPSRFSRIQPLSPLAAEGQAQGGEEEVRVVVNHAEFFSEGLFSPRGRGAEPGHQEGVAALKHSGHCGAAALRRHQVQEGAEQLQVRRRGGLHQEGTLPLPLTLKWRQKTGLFAGRPGPVQELGIAWDPWNTGKNVIRAGIGLYYENVIFNNVLFDRPLRLQNGAFLQTPTPCVFGTITPLPGAGQPTVTPADCGLDANGNQLSLGAVGADISSLEQQYRAANPFSLTNPNPNYIVSGYLNGGVNFPLGLFAPNYKTPRSTQINVGIQHEFAPGIIGSVDYVRNVTTGLLLGVDLNHTGDVKYFNKNNALTAINSVTQAMGCGPFTSTATIDCAIAAGATFSSFTGAGLDSQGDLGGTGSCPPGGCAFGGLNPTAPSMTFMVPAGISKYNALEAKLTFQKNHVFKWLGLNGQISYAYSSFKNSGGGSATAPGAIANSDQDFVIPALDNNNPNQYFGPSLLDRPQQFSFGVVGNLPWNLQLSIIGHFYSSLPLPIIVPGTGAGAIFMTDFNGDGTTQ